MSRLAVEVVLALEDRQLVTALEVEPGTTLAEAILRSGLQARTQELDLQLDLSTAAVGIFGRLRERDTVLADGDRVEIYRPLLADPKDARRRRAVVKHARGGRRLRDSESGPG